MRKISGRFGAGVGVTALMGMLLATAIAAPAQNAVSFTTLHSFDYTDGQLPDAGLIQAADGNLYGTAAYGGASSACLYGCGTVFKITPSGTLTTLHSFDGTDGYEPSGLVQATDGDFYGTTTEGGTSHACSSGGLYGCGTVFKITPSGTLTTLHNFDGTDGSQPDGALVQARDGNFYGTTFGGGAIGNGTVFKITPGGTLTTLYSWDYGEGGPNGLVQATDGNFYGTTDSGGANGDGTVFKITPSGTLTTLHSFDGTDGFLPSAAMIQARDGNFYGTTNDGGSSHACNSEGVYGCGTIFKITPSGTLTTLHSFCSRGGSKCTDGTNPQGLVQATDGNFYGTTLANFGTVFKITGEGKLTTLYNFDGTDGYIPTPPLVQDTDGNFYGTTNAGGTSSACNSEEGVPGCGTIFSLSLGLAHFVETEPASGSAGAAVKILGTELTGATSVSFNGTAAVFTVVSPSLITTTVPSGATTGPVQVVTPSGTLTSNVPFRVEP